MENNLCSFGVAGNFTGHLEQAGEAKDFTNIKTVEANAPKAVFPTFINSSDSSCPDFLKINPFDSKKIIFPKNEEKVQIEPECGITVKLSWNEEKITDILPLTFGASNDCSIRKDGAKKISEKKNWGASSKGFAENQLKIDSFSEKGNINSYRIASFIKRDNKVYIYGEDSAIRDYSYIYEKLINWLKEKLNNQINEGPAEEISKYLISAGKPENIMISIGATRYTDFGQHNFLQNEDVTYVILYPETKYSKEDIFKLVESDNFSDSEISALVQKVVL